MSLKGLSLDPATERESNPPPQDVRSGSMLRCPSEFFFIHERLRQLGHAPEARHRRVKVGSKRRIRPKWNFFFVGWFFSFDRCFGSFRSASDFGWFRISTVLKNLAKIFLKKQKQQKISMSQSKKWQRSSLLQLSWCKMKTLWTLFQSGSIRCDLSIRWWVLSPMKVSSFVRSKIFWTPSMASSAIHS